MDHMKILSRAWKITWQQRALWLFGFLFVLTGGSNRGGGSGGGSGGGGGGGGGAGGPGPWGVTPPNIDWTLVAIIIGVVIVVFFLIGIAMTILRYVAETAIIAGVDESESADTKLTVRRGFRLGWSRQAFKLFLVDLVIGIPMAIIIIAMLAIAASPFLIWAAQVPEAVQIIVTLIGVGMILLVILLIIAIALFVSLVEPYIRRRVVLGKQGVFASIGQGIRLVRASLLDTGLMWLLLAGIGIVWGLVLIPVFLVLAVANGFVALIPAGLTYLLASQSWIAAVIVGLLLMFIMFVPVMSFIQGLFEVYTSSTWTLAYREVTTRHADLLPAPAASP